MKINTKKNTIINEKKNQSAAIVQYKTGGTDDTARRIYLQG
jgi:hypothetical protein